MAPRTRTSSTSGKASQFASPLGVVRSRVSNMPICGAHAKQKYGRLTKHHVGTGASNADPDSPYYFFEPQNTDCRAEYDKGWKINEAMPVNSAGFITARDHFVVDFDKEVLLFRMADFANPKLSDSEIRTKYFAGCGSPNTRMAILAVVMSPQRRKRVH